jgi:putative nucleotidyltransferase with HDIG domain
MTEAINTAMLEMQCALLARSLYPDQHPRIRSSEQRASELLRTVLARRPEITLFALDDRVVLDDQALPASASLVQHLFRRLRQNGADSITFHRGLDESEIRAFLGVLAEGDDGRRVLKSAHLSVGYIRQQAHEAEWPARLPDPDAVPLPGELAGVLRGVWDGIEESRSFDEDGMDGLLGGISKALADSSGAVLPLASLKEHDEYTYVHTINVAILSTALAEAVGFSGRDVHNLGLAALLHDVGKRIVPHELLNKAGRFTDEEFRLVQQHPAAGARMLLATPRLPDVAPIVAYEHHVRSDGGGYPELPRQWRLSLASRIVQVADIFDALHTNRPYRPALPVPEIIDLMRKDVGVFFDADLLEAFFDHVISRGL